MDKSHDLSRRGFLKTSALTVAAMTIGSTLDKVQAFTTPKSYKPVKLKDTGAAIVTQQRTLGKRSLRYACVCLGVWRDGNDIQPFGASV